MPEVDDLSPGQLIMNSYAGRFDDLSVPLWLNLGYWKKAQSYTKACEDLAALVATTAEFGGNARVLDAGCGFAEPARFWATKYGVKVHAINNDLFQVDVASARIERLNLADQVRVTHGAATKLALPWQCFDAVVALESAFQFNTREDFVVQSMRVLVPGGRVVIADLASRPGYHQSEHNRIVRKRARIPECNVYDAGEYNRRILDAGFEHVDVQSIRSMVYPGMSKLLHALAGTGRSLDTVVVRLSPEEIESCTGASLWEDYFGLGDFVLVSARKPI